MTVVIHLNGRIDPEFDRLFHDGAVLARDTQGDILARLNVIGEPEHIGNLGSVQTQSLSSDSLGELEREDAHSNEV